MAARTEAETNVNLGPKWIWLLDDVTFKETHLNTKIIIIKIFILKMQLKKQTKANSCTQFKMCNLFFPMEINFIFSLSLSPSSSPTLRVFFALLLFPEAGNTEKNASVEKIE